jgi:hypothetical protein
MAEHHTASSGTAARQEAAYTGKGPAHYPVRPGSMTDGLPVLGARSKSDREPWHDALVRSLYADTGDFDG